MKLFDVIMNKSQRSSRFPSFFPPPMARYKRQYRHYRIRRFVHAVLPQKNQREWKRKGRGGRGEKRSMKWAVLCETAGPKGRCETMNSVIFSSDDDLQARPFSRAIIALGFQFSAQMRASTSITTRIERSCRDPIQRSTRQSVYERSQSKTVVIPLFLLSFLLMF